MHRTFRKLALAVASAGLLTLYGCGGSGGDAGAGGAAAVTVSGTAAAGLPLVGTVTVKDANGVVRSTAIGANGSYAVDVSGMSAPFVFRADGTVGGRRVVIHSAASAADANGTINITPLTDLIVANIAGQLAANYFDGGNFSALTRAELDAETASLKAKLLPVLLAMGVDASVDLLRTAFTPLADALDKALDVLRVSIDPDTNRATITNLVTQQAIIDDLATKAAAETAATPMAGDGMGTAADDIGLIRKALGDFAAKFANGLPSPGDLTPLMHDTPELPFRDVDLNAEQFRNELAGDTFLIGASFADVVIRRINYNADVAPRAIVAFNVRNSKGVIIDRVDNMQLAKAADGIWRLRGDNRRLDIYSQAHIVKDGLSGCVNTGLEFGIEDRHVANSASIAYMLVTGPGLPQAGLKYERPDDGGQWRIQNVDNQRGAASYIQASNCFDGAGSARMSDAAIAAIPDDAVYLLKAFDSQDQPVLAGGSAIEYTERVLARPLTLTEAAAASFPGVTTTPALGSYSGGEMVISATGINPSGAWVYLGLIDGMGGSISDERDVEVAAGGTVSVTLDLPVTPNVIGREVRVETRDPFWRVMMTILNHRPAPR